MLRGMFDFNAVNENTLGFKASEPLLYLGTHKLDKNWMRACNEFGQVGLVPVNYVKIDHDYTGEILMEFLNGAILKLRRGDDSRLEELLKLRDRIISPSREMKDQIIELEDEIRRTRRIAISELGNLDMSYVPDEEHDSVGYRRSRSSASETSLHSVQSVRENSMVPYPTHSNKSGATTHNRTETVPKLRESSPIPYLQEQEPSRSPILEPGPMPSSSSPPQPTPRRVDTIQISEYRLVGEIIDAVRNAASISHEKSQVAVQIVIQALQEKFPQMTDPLASLMRCLDVPSAISKVPDLIKRSPDAKKLTELFRMLSECKDDEQQRSWAVHEDEMMIQGSVADLQSILLSADHSISQYVMKVDHYVGVDALALLYQMETRKSIRTILREVFIAICKIDRTALSVLANSILPMELAREFQECYGDRYRLFDIAKLLSLMMCTGESLPICHYEYLGADFIRSVLRIIEEPPEGGEMLSTELTNFLLGYNLQFLGPEHNLTVQALGDMHAVPTFSQRVINLLNWGKDPLSIELPHGPPETNSVFKILTDIFSSPRAAKVFYTNDIKVLVDIIIRWLTDLGAGDKRRTLFLTLIRHIMRNSSYPEHQHRKEDLCECFTRILLEDDGVSVPAQRIIKDIYMEFPILKIR